MHTPPERKWDGSVVRYPDPAIEVIDPRFGDIRLATLSLNGCGQGRAGQRDLCGSAMAGTCCGAIFRTIGY